MTAGALVHHSRKLRNPYSQNDVARVQRITVLLAAGLNLSRVQHVLELEAETAALRAEVDRPQREL